MINSVTSVPPSQPQAVVQPVPEKPKTEPTKKQPASTDTVQISGSAKAAAQAALQEATETATQTAKEAQTGDLQAKRLLAKEAEQKAVY